MANESGKQKSHAWLISFTDVMALMLTFFVLLFSMSATEEEEWKGMSSALKQEFQKQLNESSQPGPEVNDRVTRVRFNAAQSVMYLKSLFEADIKSNEALKDAEIYVFDDRLIITFPNSFIFGDDMSATEITQEAKRALYVLGDSLSKIKNAVMVSSHVKPRGGSSANDTEEWKQSMTRAVAVAAIFEKVGYTKPIDIQGHASGRYIDYLSSANSNELDVLANRIDVIILDNDGTLSLQSQRSGL